MKTDSVTPVTRRAFLKTGTAAGSLMILPGGMLRGQERKPGARLNVAFIGMGRQIQGHVSQIMQLGHNVAALCDVDAGQMEESRKPGRSGSFRKHRRASPRPATKAAHRATC